MFNSTGETFENKQKLLCRDRSTIMFTFMKWIENNSNSSRYPAPRIV